MCGNARAAHVLQVGWVAHRVAAPHLRDCSAERMARACSEGSVLDTPKADAMRPSCEDQQGREAVTVARQATNAASAQSTKQVDPWPSARRQSALSTV